MGAGLNRQRWLEVIAGRDRSTGAALLRGAATLAEGGYRLAVACRNGAYDAGVKPSRRAHAPVLSVGNLTTGGTGKTPIVMHIARRLRAMGRRPAILMRGYMADADAPSDEAALYREALADAAVVVDPDRVAGAAAVAAERPEVDALVLDDGFQHRRIARDLDLVLIDASEPWGYGHALPRGLMREPRSALRRADAVVLTHCEGATAAELAALDAEVGRWHGRPPIAHVEHAWEAVVDASGATVASGAVGASSGRRRVVAFCGLGNPGRFFEEAGRWFEVAEAHSFEDHHRYDERSVEWLADRLASTGAEAGLTSEKDWSRLAPLPGAGGGPAGEAASAGASTKAPAIWRSKLALRFASGAGALDELLGRAVDDDGGRR